MKYIKKIEGSIIGECESCGKKLKISINRLEKVGDNFKCIKNIFCECGREHELILKSTYTVAVPSINNSNLIQCPSCNQAISSHANNCIKCGHPIKVQKRMSFWKVVLAIIVAFFIIVFLL